MSVNNQNSFPWWLIMCTHPGADTGGGCRGCITPLDLRGCWHDTWFHWKSPTKYFWTAHYSL